jgi:hypothetical protein
MSVTIPENDQHSNIFHSENGSGFGQSSFDPYVLPSDDDEYLTPKFLAETTPGQTDRAAQLLNTGSLDLNLCLNHQRTGGK